MSLPISLIVILNLERQEEQEMKFKSTKKNVGLGKKKKECPFCLKGASEIDYKDIRLLSRFISERGRIIHRRAFGVSANHQRLLGQAIKRARFMALLPYSSLKLPWKITY